MNLFYQSPRRSSNLVRKRGCSSSMVMMLGGSLYRWLTSLKLAMLPAALRRRLSAVLNPQQDLGVSQDLTQSFGHDYHCPSSTATPRPASASSKESTISISSNASGYSTPDLEKPQTLTTYESNSGLRWNRVSPGNYTFPDLVSFLFLVGSTRLTDTTQIFSIFIASKRCLWSPATRPRHTAGSQPLYRRCGLSARSATCGPDRWRSPLILRSIAGIRQKERRQHSSLTFTKKFHPAAVLFTPHDRYSDCVRVYRRTACSPLRKDVAEHNIHIWAETSCDRASLCCGITARWRRWKRCWEYWAGVDKIGRRRSSPQSIFIDSLDDGVHCWWRIRWG